MRGSERSAPRPCSGGKVSERQQAGPLLSRAGHLATHRHLFIPSAMRQQTTWQVALAAWRDGGSPSTEAGVAAPRMAAAYV